MAVELILAPEVNQDVGEAFQWYEDRRLGLGEEFLSCVAACLHRICRRPELYAKVHQDFRRALVRRFPYAIFYEASAETVTVHAIFHTSQDPTKWRGRLK